MSNKTYKDIIRERFLNKKRQASITRSPAVKNILKLNKDYLKEESEVTTIIQEREKGDEINLSKQQFDQEELFFTSFISEPDFHLATSTNSSRNENDISNKSDEIIDNENIHESPTHMASSYLQIDDFSVTEKIEVKKLHLTDDHLYFPSKKERFAPELLNMRILENEGLYVPDSPNISKNNKNRFLNRFVSETDLIFQNYSGKKIQQSRLVDRIIPVYIPPVDLSQNISSHVLENRIIRIEIKEIVFHHHPLFNEEEILAKKIENYYSDYIGRKQNNLTEKYKTKLQNLREMLKNYDDDNLNVKDIAELKKYKKDLTSYRNRLHREEKYDLSLLKSLLESWKNLKIIREKQGYNYTTLKLVIKKEETNFENDQKIWNERFDTELIEIYNEKLEIYYQEKRKLKSITENESQGELTSIEFIQKIKKPEIEKIREYLTKIFIGSLRHPGEPKLEVELIEIALTEAISHPKVQQRRALLSKTKYFIKLVFDNDNVTSPKEIVLNCDFTINVNALFTVKLTTLLPKKIKMEIYEQNSLKISSHICTLYLPLPDTNEIFKEIEYQKIDFTAESKNQTKDSTKYMSGTIKMKMGWLFLDENKKSQNFHRNPITKNEEITTKLKSWYDDFIIDPLDPDNKLLIDAINTKTTIKKERGSQNLFRFNEDLIAFCSQDELNQNVRFNLLKGRDDQNLKFKNLKLIPSNDREIEVPEDFNIVEEAFGMDPIDIQRHRGNKYLKNVYEAITHHLKLIHKDKEENDVLIGDEVPTFSSLSLAILEIFGPKRPLKPTRKTHDIRKSYRLDNIQLFNIIVNVERAFGIPIRNEEQNPHFRKNSTNSTTPQSYKTVNVRPYVSISYKDKIARTSTAEGSNPTWNEQLTLIINKKMSVLKGSLSIQLFDEYIEDLLEDDRSRTTDIYQRISSKWIGELRIPISTIFSIQRIEGIFEINIPSLLLGYIKSPFSTNEQSTIIFGNLPDVRGNTHISLYISVDPVFEIEKLQMNCLESTELLSIKSLIEIWKFEYNNEFPARPQHSLVTLINGTRVCITRLIGKISIPFDHSDDAEQLIRRFVSLIPVFQTMDPCTDLDGVWLTNNLILNLTCASSKDLGILLTCFYITLGINAWAILGYGLSGGNSVYVLIKELNEYFIVDPVSGKKFSSKDIYCPLITVYSLINEKNMWGNIQRETRVYMTQFDVTKSRDWRPLFTKNIEAPTELIHDLNYEYTASSEIIELQRIIELKLVKKISSWRTHRKTIWNRYVNENLSKLLLDLEQSICFEYNTEQYKDKLSFIFTSYKVNGFPINLPYISLSSIVDRVKSTGIHLISDENVEFSLAVKIFEYPRNILSVWIFLVSLVPKLL